MPVPVHVDHCYACPGQKPPLYLTLRDRHFRSQEVMKPLHRNALTERTNDQVFGVAQSDDAARLTRSRALTAT